MPTVPQLRDIHKITIQQIRRYRDDTKWFSRAHKDRWNRCLAAMGEGITDKPMTSLEAQSYVDRGWHRWNRIPAIIKEFENADTTDNLATRPGHSISESNAKKIDPIPQAPDYKQDYKDACNVINDLRSQLNTANQKLSTTSHKLKSAAARADRQQERADKLAQQLKNATPDDKWEEKYYELEWEHTTLQNEFTDFKSGKKIDYNDAMSAILTGAVVDTNSFAITGAEHLTGADMIDINNLNDKLTEAKELINIWLWDITHIPPGLIGQRYKGKSYNEDMGAYLHHVDGLVHSAYQMIEATQDYITRGKVEAGK